MLPDSLGDLSGLGDANADDNFAEGKHVSMLLHWQVPVAICKSIVPCNCEKNVSCSAVQQVDFACLLLCLLSE
jgi:hypothetical protein